MCAEVESTRSSFEQRYSVAVPVAAVLEGQSGTGAGGELNQSEECAFSEETSWGVKGRGGKFR